MPNEERRELGILEGEVLVEVAAELDSEGRGTTLVACGKRGAKVVEQDVEVGMIPLELRGDLRIGRNTSRDGREEQLVLDVVMALDLVGEAAKPPGSGLASTAISRA